MDMKHGLVPAAFVAALFLAAPSWAAGKNDTGANAKDRSDSASTQAAVPQHSNAQNHTQGEVNEECLREDPRKHPADVACAKLKSKRHPAVKDSAHTAQPGAAGH